MVSRALLADTEGLLFLGSPGASHLEICLDEPPAMGAGPCTTSLLWGWQLPNKTQAGFWGLSSLHIYPRGGKINRKGEKSPLTVPA